MLGLPESGKTSFLAAFVYYIDAEIEEKRLTQSSLSSNTSYISMIRQSWLKVNKPERTKTSASRNKNTTAEVYLLDKITRENITLLIHDNFGEAYESQFIHRFLDSDYVDMIRDSSGMILFIHPETIKYPTLIEDLQPAFNMEEEVNNMFEGDEEGGLESPPQNRADESSVEQIAPFQIEETPTAVVLVDILDANISFVRQKPVDLAVVISAWDVVSASPEEISPLKWIELNLPLLYQYLVSNREIINFKTFGISAVGGDLSNMEVAEALRKLNEPMDRVIIVEDETTHKNIASPLEWIVNQWQTTRP